MLSWRDELRLPEKGRCPPRPVTARRNLAAVRQRLALGAGNGTGESAGASLARERLAGSGSTVLRCVWTAAAGLATGCGQLRRSGNGRAPQVACGAGRAALGLPLPAAYCAVVPPLLKIWPEAQYWYRLHSIRPLNSLRFLSARRVM